MERALASCGRLSALWPKAELGSTHGSDLVYSILSPEWNVDKNLRRQGSLLDCSRTPVPGNRFCAGRSLWRRLIYGGGWIHEDSSHNILTLDAL
jgi:hypothetical protein